MVHLQPKVDKMKSRIGGATTTQIRKIRVSNLEESVMTIEIADRLIKLRKKNGLSQEELADKLGLSRQAVSKWERAEASPDTDNLICLAKIYGVSLDELLNTDATVEEIVEEQVKTDTVEAEEVKAEEIKKKDSVNIDSTGIHVVDEEGNEVHIGDEGIKLKDKNDKVRNRTVRPEEKKRRKIISIVNGITSGILVVGITIAYILLMTLTPNGGWWASTFWLYYLSLPIVWSLFSVIKRRKISNFAYPVAAVMAYLAVGLYLGIWHPTWVIFITIPVFYIIFGQVDKATRKRRHEKAYVEEYMEDDEDDDNDYDEDDKD